MMCERALSRESHGKVIAEHQMVQEAIADSYAEINMLRLLVLWTAWTIDNSSTQEARTQIAACKYTCAKVLREVAYRALHILGSLGTTNLTPLQAMCAGAPTMAIADGVDEVHKVTVARNVLKGYKPHEGLWPTEYIPAKREEARKKYAEPDRRRPGPGRLGRPGRARDHRRRALTMDITERVAVVTGGASGIGRSSRLRSPSRGRRRRGGRHRRGRRGRGGGRDRGGRAPGAGGRRRTCPARPTCRRW